MINAILISAVAINTLIGVILEIKRYRKDSVNYSIFDKDKRKIILIILIALCMAGITPESLRYMAMSAILLSVVIVTNILCILTYIKSKKITLIITIILMDIASIGLVYAALF